MSCAYLRIRLLLRHTGANHCMSRYMVRGMKLSDMQKVMEDKYNFKAR